MTGNPLSLLMQSLTLKQAVVDLEPAEMTIEDWLLQVRANLFGAKLKCSIAEYVESKPLSLFLFMMLAFILLAFY